MGLRFIFRYCRYFPGLLRGGRCGVVFCSPVYLGIIFDRQGNKTPTFDADDAVKIVA
jgi:hypothetical protein